MTPASTAMIEVRHLTLGYPDRVLLEDISFDVPRGRIFVILGGSGCGKSTLLKHLIGLNRPLSGSIRIEGADITRATGQDRLAILRRFGVMYQSGALFGSMTVSENVQLPLEEFTLLPRQAREWIALSRLKSVGMLHAAHRLPSELSGGMQKRAAIARAMALNPSLLFLDEPSAGLDPVTSADLDQLILSLSREAGITFVIVTHELPSILTVADEVIMLDGPTRSIIDRGHPARLRDHSPHPGVRQFFLREPSRPPRQADADRPATASAPDPSLLPQASPCPPKKP